MVRTKRTKLGQFFYDITLKANKFLMKHMWLYYLLNYTWGAITTILGWIIVPIVDICTNKAGNENGKFGPCYYVLFGNNWGGLELGTNFLVSGKMGEEYTLHTKQHETGHSFQNAVWGPLAIFLIYLPSVFRYWYQNIRYNSGLANTKYDLIWFEGNDSETGKYYYDNYMNK